MSPALTFIPPMECLPLSRLPEGLEWSYEVKLDGYRAYVINRLERAYTVDQAPADHLIRPEDSLRRHRRAREMHQLTSFSPHRIGDYCTERLSEVVALS